MNDLDQRLAIIQRQLPLPAREKIDDLAFSTRLKVPYQLKEPDFIDKVKHLLEALLTEEATDAAIDIVKGVLPWWARGIVGRTLDYILPDRLLAVLYLLLDKIKIGEEGLPDA